MIESIYVEKDFRDSGIGDKLMTGALGWLDDMSADKRIIEVAEGNEEVLAFYRRFNFYPRRTVLEQARNLCIK